MQFDSFDIEFALSLWIGGSSRERHYLFNTHRFYSTFLAIVLIGSANHTLCLAKHGNAARLWSYV